MKKLRTIFAFGLRVGDTLQFGDELHSVRDLRGIWFRDRGLVLRIYCDAAQFYAGITDEVKILRNE